MNTAVKKIKLLQTFFCLRRLGFFIGARENGLGVRPHFLYAGKTLERKAVVLVWAALKYHPGCWRRPGWTTLFVWVWELHNASTVWWEWCWSLGWCRLACHFTQSLALSLSFLSLSLLPSCHLLFHQHFDQTELRHVSWVIPTSLPALCMSPSTHPG